MGKRKGVWFVKVGKCEHPEHILNRFFETFIIYSTGRRLQSNEGGQNDKKKTSKYVLFPSRVVIIHACVCLLAERTKIPLKYSVFTKTQNVVYGIIPRKSFRSCTVKYSIIP